MDPNALDKLLAEQDARWKARLAQHEDEEANGPYDDNPTPVCDHVGHYRLVGGLHVAIRICTQCGKSWRLPVQGDYLIGDFPVAEWEEIKEPVQINQDAKFDYD